jgi:hypothetical protein
MSTTITLILATAAGLWMLVYAALVAGGPWRHSWGRHSTRRWSTRLLAGVRWVRTTLSCSYSGWTGRATSSYIDHGWVVVDIPCPIQSKAAPPLTGAVQMPYKTWASTVRIAKLMTGDRLVVRWHYISGDTREIELIEDSHGGVRIRWRDDGKEIAGAGQAAAAKVATGSTGSIGGTVAAGPGPDAAATVS